MTSWDTITIGDLIDNGEASLQTGPFGTQLKASEYVESGIPIINVKNIGYDSVRAGDLDFVAEKTADRLRAHRLETGDIVFGRKGAADRHVFIRPACDGWLQGSDCMRLRLKTTRVMARFLSYYFCTSEHKYWMEAVCAFGATMSTLNQGIVRRISLRVPDAEFQNKIAGILSAYDELIENNKQRLALLERMAEEIYLDWFVRFRFPGHEKVKLRKGVPDGWSVKTFREIVEHYIGGGWGEDDQSTSFCDGAYRNFLHTGTVTDADAAQPKDSEEMRKFLGQNKRLVFTLIQKFGWPAGMKYPELSPRSDIIVMVDEAHRTQYKTLAENMRAGLANAQYLAFTGTPLLGRERKTNQWFGDYVSEYNFQQSMDDGATVPLFYQKRVPQVLIQNENLEDEFAEIVEDENLDDAQEAKLENRFAKEIEVIKREDRLQTIAEDIVYHFARRGYLGKGMVVPLDKFTAVKMYDKVRRLWRQQIKELRGSIRKSTDPAEKHRLQRRLDYMRTMDMAVIVSEEGEEEKKFAKQKLNIKPHRERMNTVDDHGHDIEYNFKDPKNPLQLVFVCAMWLTGFDAPILSTLYLDKPMKDHTLMQTIARANRVTSWKINEVEKKNGELIDYYNVFRNMRKALKDYAQGQEGQEALPVQEKTELFKLLHEAIEHPLNHLQCIAVQEGNPKGWLFPTASLLEESDFG
jgi:SWI2/SNF2 ATPase/Type I restriction modification DNA specificity domain